MYFFVCFAVLLISVACNGQSTSSSDRSSACKLRNMFQKVDGKCDAYVECRDYHSINMQCPDGLHFDPRIQWPAYPCGYPQDVPCVGRGVSQPAIRNADCPHQYGYFLSPLAHASDCGQYRICIAGTAVEMYCPTGLAFNPVSARCDWPDVVPSCNVDNYLGFKCPPVAVDENRRPVVTNHKYEDDCYAFYTCVNGHARVSSCDSGFAFNPITSRCEDSERVKCSSRTTATSH